MRQGLWGGAFIGTTGCIMMGRAPTCLRQIKDLTISILHCRYLVLDKWSFFSRGCSDSEKHYESRKIMVIITTHSIDMQPGPSMSGSTVIHATDTTLYKEYRTPVITCQLQLHEYFDFPVTFGRNQERVQVRQPCSHRTALKHGNDRAESNMGEWLRGVQRNSNMETRRLQAYGGRRKVTLCCPTI